MKQLIYILLIVIGAASCGKTDIDLQSADLDGEWWSENAVINGVPASTFLSGNELYPSILGFRNVDEYFLNYSSGTYTIEDDKIDLSNAGVYTILAYQDSLMTLEVRTLAGRLYWDLEGVAADELITLREDYRRR